MEVICMKTELSTELLSPIVLSPFFDLDPFESEVTPLTFWSDEGKNAQLQVELAGVDKSDIKVQLGKEHIEITATKKIKTKNKETSRTYHNYFSIPSSLKAESIKAEYKNGVLTLTADKQPEEVKKMIAVK